MNEAVTVRIERAELIDPALRDELERWSDAEFGAIAYEWAPAQWYAAAWLDRALAGSLTIVTREVRAGAEHVRVAGIGNVMTKPEFRRRSIASAMMNAAADLMRSQLDVEFGFLICHPRVAPVYSKVEWRRVEGPTRFRQPAAVMAYPYDTMVLKLTDREWPNGAIDLCGLPW